MLTSYAVAVLAMVVLAVAWVGVQSAWRRTFPGAMADPDVLAGRMGCHGCDSTEDCDRRSPDGTCTVEEENR